MSTKDESLNPSITELAEALYTINRHAKTAPNPKYLYALKKNTITKLINEKKAKKLGIQLSPNPKFSKQQLDVLVKVDNYYFHIPTEKGDSQKLPHLGDQNVSYRNPKVRVPLKKATITLEKYAGKPSIAIKQNNQKFKSNKAKAYSNEHLFLGKQ
jgi:hypothetical protein